MSFFTRSIQRPTRERTTAEDDLTSDHRPQPTPGDDTSRPRDDAAGEGAVGRRRARLLASRAATVLACLFVLFALIAPNEIGRFTPGAFARIPLEGLLGVALVLVLPAKARRITAVVFGVVLGLLTILKIIDMGFHATLDRPFRPALDWSFVEAGLEFLGQSAGGAGATGAVVAVVVLIAAVIALMTLSVLRLTRLVVRHRTAAGRAAVALGAAWVVCALLGAQLAPGSPVAAVALDRTLQIRDDLRDRKPISTRATDDAFHDTPGKDLLTALRGKDVILAFVESYGRDALEDPRFATRVGAVLDDGTRRLDAAGFSSRSAFLTSPTAGGGSWLAHSTLLSGLWIDTQQRHQRLVTSDRMTLTRAFQRAGWRTVAVMPGNTRPWPEGRFYGHQKIYNRVDLGYKGPKFNWDTPPDQYTLETFQRTERAEPGHAPVMAEIALVSSHSPWAPTPRLIGWDDVGDGKVFGPIAAAGDRWQDVWRSPGRMRTAYRGSIEYTLSTLVSYVETYGDDDLVLVFLGDHQPAPIITGVGAGRDVPITIVTRDQTVLDRVSGWNWHSGLKPGHQAPVWRMDTFRDRFLTAFGSRPRPGH